MAARKVKSTWRTEPNSSVSSAELAGVDQRRRQSEAALQVHFERHDVRFAQRIDGRIGNLRETLLAVIPQRARQRGKKRRRRVIAHAPVGFFAVHERGEKHFELIFGPAGGGGDAFWLFGDRGGGRWLRAPR